MEKEQKKIEELNGFRDLRIVDNFYKHQVHYVFHITLQEKTIMQ